MEKLYNRSSIEIDEFILHSAFSSNKRSIEDSKRLSLDYCEKFKELPTVNEEMLITRHVYNKNKIGDDDAYYYNPYISDDLTTLDSTKPEQHLLPEIDQCLEKLNEISELSLFRFI